MRTKSPAVKQVVYDDVVRQILQKYRIIDQNGNPTQCNLKSPPQQPLGPGPLLAPDALEQFINADKTPEHKWLDWIIYQAGGGEKGESMRDAALQQIKDRFMDERTNGFQHPETHEFVPAVSRKEAEKRWEASEPSFRNLLQVCNQDAVLKLNTFGFFRHWPGNDRKYEKVVKEVTRFQTLYPKLLQMNKEIVREGKEPLDSEPNEIKGVGEMEKISDTVERYFASKQAREDIRLSGHPQRKDSMIYNDDYLYVVSPLTWAAAVRHGYDEWAWANREKFDTVLSSEGSNDYNNEWKSRTQRGNVYVYIIFKVPVPVWLTRQQGTFKRMSLTNLALELNKDQLKGLKHPDNWTVWDEENRNTLKIADVKDMILAEPTRVDPQDEEVPIPRGANVYKSQEEAQEVVAHLDAALQAIQEWAKTFNPKTIKSDALKLDVPEEA